MGKGNQRLVNWITKTGRDKKGFGNNRGQKQRGPWCRGEERKKRLGIGNGGQQGPKSSMTADLVGEKKKMKGRRIVLKKLMLVGKRGSE